MAYDHQHMNPPGGAAAMIPAFVILGGLSLVLMGGAQEWFQSGNALFGWGAVLGIGAIWAFLIFVLVLHARAGALWSWYCSTGRVPQPKKGGFWKGAGLGALFGLAVLFFVIKAVVGADMAEGEVVAAETWVVVFMVYGGMFFMPCVLVPALIGGWAERAWDRSAIPPPLKNVSGPGGSEWQRGLK